VRPRVFSLRTRFDGKANSLEAKPTRRTGATQGRLLLREFRRATSDARSPGGSVRRTQAFEVPELIPSAAVPAAPRLGYVDGLRALAALWVAFHHVIVTSEPSRLMALPVFGPVLGSLFSGQFAVMVFLLLSGFCLYYPYVKKQPIKPAFTTGYFPYLWRRFKRIAPPYYWAGAFCLLITLFPPLMIGEWRAAGPIDAGTILSHLVFVHNLIPEYSARIDYPMWSIGLEWQLYLLFPLLVWAFCKSNGWLVTGVAFLGAGAVRAVQHHVPPALGSVLRDGPFAYLEIFCAGMLVAAYTAQRRRIAPNWLLGCIVIGGLLSVRLGSGGGLVHDLSAAASAFAVLMLSTDEDSWAARVLNTPWLVRVGVYSYSIYLIHAPLLHLCWYFLRPLQLSKDLEFAILCVAMIPIVFVCYGFHYFFERPFMRSGHGRAPSSARAALPTNR